MSSWKHVIRNGKRYHAAQLAREAILAAPDGAVLVIEEPQKSRIQENKYHAMIGDIAHGTLFGGQRYNERSWKRLLVEAFVNVLRADAMARGEEAPFPGDVDLVQGIDGQIVALGEQTRHFTRTQSNDFIEYLYAFGVERGVVWSEPAERVIQAMLTRKRQEALIQTNI